MSTGETVEICNSSPLKSFFEKKVVIRREDLDRMITLSPGYPRDKFSVRVRFFWEAGSDFAADCFTNPPAQRIIAGAIQTVDLHITDSLTEPANPRQNHLNIWRFSYLSLELGYDPSVIFVECFQNRIGQTGNIKDERPAARHYAALVIHANCHWGACADEQSDALAALRKDLTEVGHIAIGIMRGCAIHSMTI